MKCLWQMPNYLKVGHTQCSPIIPRKEGTIVKLLSLQCKNEQHCISDYQLNRALILGERAGEDTQ